MNKSESILFYAFVKEENVKIYGVEAAGHGIETGQHAAAFQGSEGVIHGMKTYLLQDKDGNITPAHSISAGLDYPGVGPEHAYLKDLGAARYDNVTDQEALDAFVWLSRKEGIIPAFESAHAIGYLKKMPKEEIKGKVIIVNLSGRGDKDMVQAKSILEIG